jgi:dextranase
MNNEKGKVDDEMKNVQANIIDVFPSKAQFRPGEELMFQVETEGEVTNHALRIVIRHLHETIEEKTIFLHSSGVITVTLDQTISKEAGYGIEVQLIDQNEDAVSSKTSAFDVASHWNKAPRYGFLSEFHPDEKGKLEDIETLNKFHINIVQFYDWMYRHDRLVPEETNFTDPLGRPLSIEVIQEKIHHAHQKGMAALAYGAIYASLKDFFDQHIEWGLYQNDGIPYTLADLFYIMDISPDSPWNDHIINEFKKVIEFGFDGIHLDQYGYPKKAFTRNKELVDLSKCFLPFINRTKEELSFINQNVGLIFNNVGNFPTYATAEANHDVAYIEVWSPVNTYSELKRLIDDTKKYSGNKPIILAAYLAPFNPKKAGFHQQQAENGALTTMATIFASGAYHLLIGEEYKVLTEGYYPNYGEMSEPFKTKMRSYYDFIVQYQELIYGKFIDLSYTHTGGYNSEIGRDNEIEFEGKDVIFSPGGNAGTVWTIVKENDDFLVIHLINLVGLKDDQWNKPKETGPIELKDMKIRVLIEEKIDGVYLASPDHSTCSPIKLVPHRKEGSNGFVSEVSVPSLDVWSMIYFVKSKN